jgi:hypothetical protein
VAEEDADHLFPIRGDPEDMAQWDVGEIHDPDLVRRLILKDGERRDCRVFGLLL